MHIVMPGGVTFPNKLKELSNNSNNQFHCLKQNTQTLETLDYAIITGHPIIFYYIKSHSIILASVPT